MGKSVYLWGKDEHYVNYSRAIAAAGGQLYCARCLALAEDFDALLLPGGGDLAPWRYGQDTAGSQPPDEARDAAELALLDRFIVLKKPVMGVCRGLQVVNVYFGGTLFQDLPGHSTAVRDRLHTVYTARGPLQTLMGDRCIVNSAHHQAVDRLGSGLRAVQWTTGGTVEALHHESLPVQAVQWHPERLTGSLALAGTADGGALFRWFLERL